MIYSDERIDKVNQNLSLIQKKDGLTFGTDAFLLYAYLKGKKNGTAVDLGAGTGIISLLALSKDKFSNVYAVEVQPSFADLIARNAAFNQMSARLTVHSCDARELSASVLGREVDCVFSNPPYMTTDSGYPNRTEEKYIARHEVKGDISDFCLAAGRLLKFGGSFYVVYRPDRLADLFSALRAASLEPKRMTFVHADVAHTPSLVLLEARKGGSTGLFVTKPLLLNDMDGNPTPDFNYIYENGVFPNEFSRS